MRRVAIGWAVMMAVCLAAGVLAQATPNFSGNLVVESTRPDFQGGGAPVTTKTTYKKG